MKNRELGYQKASRKTWLLRKVNSIENDEDQMCLLIKGLNVN